jgi:hypothetical protein
MFLAWGFKKGFTNGRYSVVQAAQIAQSKGYYWAALELDDPDTSEYNLSIWDEFTLQWRLHGMKAGAWFTTGGNLYQTPADSDFTIAEVEGPGDYEGVLNVISGIGAGPLPTCAKAIVTNFNTPLQSRLAAKPLIDAGFACITEAYMNENPNADPDGLDRIAKNLGWPASQPVFGVYPTASQPNPVPLYLPWKDWPGADYLGENVL